MEDVERSPLFTIIIPCKWVNKLVRKCVKYCKMQDISHEIIVVSDSECPGLPATKRNWAMDRAKGKYLAFIDSDAYPSKDWLRMALLYLSLGFVGVCGPGVIPPNSPILERATDWVYRLLPFGYRVVPRKRRIVAEFPSFNLLVRKDWSPKFKEYLTGEDTCFCRELGGFILYHPDILVYHKRRLLFRPYWKQIGTYGLHRGYLIRLVILGWLSTWIVYGSNFIRGILKKSLK